ncbi:hypothetical protein ACJX0J_020195 [Zea mays]
MEQDIQASIIHVLPHAGGHMLIDAHQLGNLNTPAVVREIKEYHAPTLPDEDQRVSSCAAEATITAVADAPACERTEFPKLPCITKFLVSFNDVLFPVLHHIHMGHHLGLLAMILTVYQIQYNHYHHILTKNSLQCFLG